MKHYDLLPQEQRDRFQELDLTFNSAGWSHLVRQWTEERDALKDRVFFGAASYEDVQHARIRYQLLEELLGLPDDLQRAKQQAVDEVLNADG